MKKTLTAQTNFCISGNSKYKQPKSLAYLQVLTRVAVGIAIAAVAPLTGCRQSSTGNDPSAVYGYLEGKHTFIVSHVFNSEIYQNRLGETLNIAPDLQGDSNLFTCFYELQITPEEMNQCGKATGLESYSDSGVGSLSEKDVWRLMVLKEEQTQALTGIIIPVSVLRGEIQKNWEPTGINTAAGINIEAAAQTAERGLPQTSQTNGQGSGQGLNLAEGQALGMGLIGIDNVVNVGLGLLGNLLGKHPKAVQTQAQNSVACLATQRAAESPVEAILSGVLSNFGNQVIGDNANPFFKGAAALGLGLVKNAFMNLIQPRKTAQDEAAARCGAELAAAADAAEKGTTIPPVGVNRESVLQAAAAVKANDSSQLKQILSDETSRVIDVLRAENFQMSSTLKDSFYHLNEQNFHELRVNIQKLSQRVGSSMNGSACLPARKFVTNVLKLSLSEKNTGLDSAESLAQRKGCVTQSQPQSQPQSQTVTPVASVPSTQTLPTTTTQTGQTAQPTTIQAADIPQELRAQIAALEKKMKEMNERIDANQSQTIIQSAPAASSTTTNSQASNTQASNAPVANTTVANAPGSGGPAVSTSEAPRTVSAFEVLKQKYAGIAPDTCFQGSVDFSSLSIDELDSKRLAFCKPPLSTTDSQNTFERFSPALRQLCVEKSVNTLLAKATCLCSCRWDTSFYKRLAGK